VKLEQLYRDIQERLDVGNKLFADNEVEIKQDFQKFIEKVYAPDFEPNTEDENELINTLKELF
jgi:tRNA A22 N-methylase